MELQKTRERKINQIRIKVFFGQCSVNAHVMASKKRKKEGKYNEAEILFVHRGEINWKH